MRYDTKWGGRLLLRILYWPRRLLQVLQCEAWSLYFGERIGKVSGSRIETLIHLLSPQCSCIIVHLLIQLELLAPNNLSTVVAMFAAGHKSSLYPLAGQWINYLLDSVAILLRLRTKIGPVHIKSHPGSRHWNFHWRTLSLWDNFRTTLDPGTSARNLLVYIFPISLQAWAETKFEFEFESSMQKDSCFAHFHPNLANTSSQYK